MAWGLGALGVLAVVAAGIIVFMNLLRHQHDSKPAANAGLAETAVKRDGQSPAEHVPNVPSASSSPNPDRILQSHDSPALGERPAVPQAYKETPTLARKWTYSSGTYAFSAKLVHQRGGMLHLRKEDGALVAAPIEQFSAGDQEYAKQWQFRIGVPDGFAFAGRKLISGIGQIPYLAWVLESAPSKGTRDVVMIVKREDKKAISGVIPGLGLVAAQEVLALSESPKAESTFRVPKHESGATPSIFMQIKPQQSNVDLPEVRAGMTFVGMGDDNALIVSASGSGERPILERREIDDVAAQLANGLKGDVEVARDDPESKSPGAKGEVWRRILLEDRVVTPKQLEGIRKNAEDLKQLIGSSGQYMVIMIPQGPEGIAIY